MGDLVSQLSRSGLSCNYRWESFKAFNNEIMKIGCVSLQLLLVSLLFIDNANCQYSLEINTGISALVYDKITSISVANDNRISFSPSIGIEGARSYKNNLFSLATSISRHSREYYEIGAITTINDEVYFVSSTSFLYTRIFANKLGLSGGLSYLNFFGSIDHLSDSRSLLNSYDVRSNLFTGDVVLSLEQKRLRYALAYKYFLGKNRAISGSYLLEFRIGYFICTR